MKLETEYVKETEASAELVRELMAALERALPRIQFRRQIDHLPPVSRAGAVLIALDAIIALCSNLIGLGHITIDGDSLNRLHDLSLGRASGLGRIVIDVVIVLRL